MGLLFADGFDLYANLTDTVRSGWWQDSDNHTINTTGGKFGGGAMSLKAADGYMSRPITIATGRTLYVCGWYKHGGTGSTDIIIRGWGTTRSSSIFTLQHNAAGDVTLLAGATSVATATGAISSGAWAWLELKVVLGTTTSNGLMQLRVNSSVVATSAATINTNTAVGIISFSGTSGASPGLWDDICFFDDQGTIGNTYPAEVRIDTLRANAAGSVNNWSGSYTDVDDTTADDDTTYAEATTAATKSNYSVDDMIVSPSAIYGVQTRAKMKKTDVGLKTARTYVRTGTAETAGTTTTMTTDYAWISSDPIQVDPTTSSAWSATALQNAFAGIEVVS